MFASGGWHGSFFSGDPEIDLPQIDRALLRRVWQYGRPYRWLLVGTLLAVIAASALGVVPAILTQRLIDEAIPNKDLGLLVRLGVLMVVVPIISALIGIVQRWWSARAGEGIIFDLRSELYRHLQAMSLRFFTNTKTGELISRVNTDVVGAQQAITGTFVTVLSNLVTVVVIGTVLVRAEWRLAVLAILAMPLFAYPARRVSRVLRRITDQQMEKNASMSAIVQETFNVSGALLVKLFGRGDRESARYSGEARAVRDLGVRRALIGRWFFAAVGLIAQVGSAAVFFAGGWLVISGRTLTGEVVMFAILLAQLYGPLTALVNARVELATSMVSFQRVFEVLDLKPEITEGTVDVPAMRGEIEFRGVSFRYQSDTPAGLEAIRRFGRRGATDEGFVPQPIMTRTWAIDDVSFRVHPGELVALVGPSGAGKTTISYLIPRLYDVDQGSVLIDGFDVRDLTFSTLAKGIGVVTQETYLFHDTIAANLRYGREDATEGELVEATKAANIFDLISTLPQVFDTVVGERGYRLSGGERQRVAIARVILKDPSVLILDEATSHLDSRSEALIQEALERLKEGRTSVVIAHRLSTILAADKILVMDRGRLVESGTHAELLAQGRLYSELFETQFRHWTGVA